jgi:hypothetical protein
VKVTSLMFSLSSMGETETEALRNLEWEIRKRVGNA